MAVSLSPALSRSACVAGALAPYDHSLLLAGVRERGAMSRFANFTIYIHQGDHHV